MTNILKDVLRFLTNRLFILFMLILGLFYILVARLYDLQIVNGNEFRASKNTNSTVPIRVIAPRGTIYDRLGRPLAVNKSTFVVIIERGLFDQKGKPLLVTSSGINQNTNNDEELRKMVAASENTKDLNHVLLQLVKLLEKNNEVYIDEFPISKTLPFEYTQSKSRLKKFRYDLAHLKINEGFTAAETVTYLRNYFEMPKEWTDIEARNVLSLRTYLSSKSSFNYTATQIAKNISEKTVAAIEEESVLFHGVSVETQSKREYPNGFYLAHILGYTGRISDDQLSKSEGLGYEKNDMVGSAGLERAFETELRGKDGTMTVEVNSLNRKVRTVSEINPIPGDKVFLTFDQELQISSYNNLLETLKSILINRILGTSQKDVRITSEEVIVSLVKNNNVSIKKIFESESGTYSYKAKELITLNNDSLDYLEDEGIKEAIKILTELIKSNQITVNEIIFIMHEQNTITGDEDYFLRLKKGFISSSQVIIEKIKADELTPQMINLDPSSGSIFAVDVSTGDVLAAVNYPTYDNNKMANYIDADYYQKTNTDLTSPFYNRVLMETRAPGSIFKMISAITGLESGIINGNTIIHDNLEFTISNQTFKCWSQTSHGDVNVVKALEVSCNYFFYEMSYRLGNRENGKTLNAIDELNNYMKEFGLNSPSGVEIGEKSVSPSGGISISSPELKKEKELSRDENASKSKYNWFDGDTVTTAIGQSYNSYNPAVIGKYIATLASRGIRYKLHFIDEIKDKENNVVKQILPEVENVINLKDETWDLVYQGMLNTVSGEYGTARHVFKDFPIKVAGKTGTAQENTSRMDHTTFVGFAPFDKPEIAIYVIIPFGDTKAVPAASSQVARNILRDYFNLDSTVTYSDTTNALVN